MIDINLLEALVVFSECKTLSKTAEKLYISQPALTKKMKKLEEDLGITLFIRKKNKLELNETGKFTAKYASRIINNLKDFEKNISSYDKSLTSFNIAYCSDIPQFVLEPIIKEEFNDYEIKYIMDDDEDFLNLLDKREYQLAVTHYIPDSNKYYYVKCGHESLYLSVPKGHHFESKLEISLKELEKMAILTYTNVGIWNLKDNIKYQKIHHLIQTDHSTYAELIATTSYPCFTTSYFARRGIQIPKRVSIKISDPECSFDYYLVCLKGEEEKFKRLFDRICENTVS